MFQIIQTKRFSVTRAGNGFDIHRILLFDEKYTPEDLTEHEIKLLQDPLDKLEKHGNMIEGDCVTIKMITKVIESVDTTYNNSYRFNCKTECVEE